MTGFDLYYMLTLVCIWSSLKDYFKHWSFDEQDDALVSCDYTRFNSIP